MLKIAGKLWSLVDGYKTNSGSVLIIVGSVLAAVNGSLDPVSAAGAVAAALVAMGLGHKADKLKAVLQLILQASQPAEEEPDVLPIEPR